MWNISTNVMFWNDLKICQIPFLIEKKLYNHFKMTIVQIVRNTKVSSIYQHKVTLKIEKKVDWNNTREIFQKHVTTTEQPSKVV